MPAALVTGSSRGIGRGIALALAAAGYDILVNYATNRDAAEQTAAGVREHGRRAELCAGNVADLEQGRRLVDATVEAFGRLDMLVNNAGMAPRQRLDLLEANAESYAEVTDTNLKGPYFLTQYAAKRMIELLAAGAMPTARIVNITSINSYAAAPSRGEYCVSKAGMTMMTRLFADRLAEHGITVNEVQPGFTETDMVSAVKSKYDEMIAGGVTPIRRWGQPEDVGKAVAAIGLGYLDFTTGAAIPVDGGYHLHRL